MRDSCGLEIMEGFYSDSRVFHYYHIKKTSEGFLIRESKEEQYSPLTKEYVASRLVRLVRQDELIDLINSVEKEKLSQSKPKCTEEPRGYATYEAKMDEKP
jgi:hypothetical protein